jgi:hypothetical protein
VEASGNASFNGKEQPVMPREGVASSNDGLAITGDDG